METHQYVRHFIEVEEEKTRYKLALKDFFTPSEWYTENNVTQSQIPEQDFSKVEQLQVSHLQLLSEQFLQLHTVQSQFLHLQVSIILLIKCFTKG